MAESFLKNNQNKNELNWCLSLKLLELHQGDQIMIATYKKTSLSSPFSPSELDTQVSVRPSEAEEADQRLVRHTLNLINGYKNIFVRTIETDILVLVISYIGKVELNDIEIYAYLINSGRCYSIKQIIREFGSDIFLALPFFYASLNLILFQVFMVRVSVNHMMFRLKVKGKWFHICFGQAWKKPMNVTSDHIDILMSFMLQLYVSKHDTLSAARLDKFEKSTVDDLRLLPLSKDAPRQHIYCASYQA